MSEKKVEEYSNEAYHNRLCDELKKGEYKKYITNEVLRKVCDDQSFYGTSITEGMLRNEKRWEDLLHRKKLLTRKK